MRVLIIEDELSIALRIERLVKEILAGKITALFRAENIGDGLILCETKQIDVLLLDLNLNGKDGFDVLKEISVRSFLTIIISAHKDRAIEAFEYGVVDFVPKPFSKERLEKALLKITDSNNAGSGIQKYLIVKNGNEMVPVLCNDIVFVAALGNYSRVHLCDDRNFLNDKNLDRLLQVLPSTFIRIHKSFIVNIGFIKRVRKFSGTRYDVELTNNTVLPIGRTKYSALKKLFQID